MNKIIKSFISSVAVAAASSNDRKQCYGSKDAKDPIGCSNIF